VVDDCVPSGLCPGVCGIDAMAEGLGGYQGSRGSFIGGAR